MNKCVEIFSEVPRRCNCAQAVAAGFDRDDLVPELRSAGGGNAPGNRCGALHAAMLIAGENGAEVIRRGFNAELGGESCSMLKKELHVPCTRCVGCAAELLEKYQNGK